MSQDRRGLLRQVFAAMMIYCVLVWICTVGFILVWPWDKGGTWKPEFRLAVSCGQGETCSLPYGQIAEARAGGKIAALQPATDSGRVMDNDFWVSWNKLSDSPPLIETNASSWYFQTSVRYRIEGDTPVLVATQEVNARAFFYGMAAALVLLAGWYLRKLRR